MREGVGSLLTPQSCTIMVMEHKEEPHIGYFALFDKYQ